MMVHNIAPVTYIVCHIWWVIVVTHHRSAMTDYNYDPSHMTSNMWRILSSSHFLNVLFSSSKMSNGGTAATEAQWRGQRLSQPLHRAGEEETAMVWRRRVMLLPLGVFARGSNHIKATISGEKSGVSMNPNLTYVESQDPWLITGMMKSIN